MSQIIQKLSELKNSEIAKVINSRLKEFEQAGKQKQEQVFSELCFCLLTANFQAEKCIKIQKELGTGFFYFPEKKLAKKLKEQGHRFPNARANYITEARACVSNLHSVLEPDGKKVREWLVKTIKGFGMKEASHFLRNIGYKDVAIIDFHILDLLEREGLIKKPQNLNKNSYFEIEKVLEELAKTSNLNLAELDLYLWYIETGKVLK